MLVLSRKIGEKIMIGEDIEVCVVEISGGKARIGITAPKNVPVFREELLPLPVTAPAAQRELVRT
jgi:carbon storage regulator